MSDLIDEPVPGQNAPEFTVSEISGAVKKIIEGNFSHVRIRGEVGRVSRPQSGHLYLDLKDDRAVLSGVIWKGVAARLRTIPEEGMEVVATGKLTTFPGQSRYQMVIEDIAPAGVGALMAMLEKRKKKLAAEGLFDAGRKRPLPYLPEVIGVVTSPSGAVIRDILHRLRERFPRTVLVWPVPVQGEKCAASVAAAIEGFNALPPGGTIPRPDLIIVARGGGSIEDLWGFNEEVVVRAAAASTIPLISAVGHETDTTLIDFASDKRAPTPTAAAELAVPVRADLMGWLSGMEDRRVRSLATGLDRRRQRLRDLARGLPNPAEMVDFQVQRLDVLAGRLPRALTGLVRQARGRLVEQSAGLRPAALRQNVAQKQVLLQRNARSFGQAARAQVDRARAHLAALELRPANLNRNIEQKHTLLDRNSRSLEQAAKAQVERLRNRLDGLERLRETLGYRKTLERGYAVVRDGDGALVPSAAAAKQAAVWDVEFADGHVPARTAGAGKPAAKSRAAPAKRGPKGQGSLF